MAITNSQMVNSIKFYAPIVTTSMSSWMNEPTVGLATYRQWVVLNEALLVKAMRTRLLADKTLWEQDCNSFNYE